MQTLPKRLVKQRTDELSDRGNPSPLLPLGGERRENEANTESDREPDPPHGHLAWDGWRGV